MEFRFWLRFETGERSGDRVPLPVDGLTAGRRTDNALVLSDASVSGKHARFVVMGGTVVLEDLGSTNGTRVEGKRIESARLAPGDQVRLGAVEFTFYDEGGEDDAPVLELEPATAPKAGSAPSAAPASEPTEELVIEEGGIALEGAGALFGDEDAGEQLGSISADRVARSGSRSALVLVSLLVVAAGGAGAWWWFGRGAAEEQARRAVAVVPGNLLANPAFEDEGSWEADESAPDAFFQAPVWRVSGEAGYGAALDPGAWARSWSAVVTPAVGRGLRLQGTASAAGAAELSVGVELSSSSGLFAPVLVQAPLVRAALVELQLEVPHLAGCDRARVVLHARAESAEGEASVDDLALVPADGAPAPGATFQEMEFHTLGAPPLSAALTRIDRVLLGNLVAAAEDGGALALTTATLETGVQLRAAGAVRFSGTVAPSVARQGVATLGRGGYQAHPLDFEAEGVTDLLVGDRIDLVRFKFASPVKLTGRAADGSLAFDARGAGAADVLLQVGFRDERNRAARLAEDARAAERDGALGRSIALWSELLDELPFDTQLVAEAGDTRGRLIQQGLGQVGELEAAFERARFFQLPGLYDEVRGAARELGATFSGSPVDDAAQSLALAVEAELGELAVGEGAVEARRLESVLEGSSQWAEGLLGQHLRAELERLRAEGDD